MKDSFSDVNPGSHIHLMGICGTAMGSLAGILKEKGYRVTGSDENVYPPMSTQLEALGIEISKGFKASNLDPRPDFVVVGNVMTKKMEEVQALLKSDIPFSSLPQILGELFLKEREGIVCCGTHGKTTTTSMVTWALECLGKHPGYLIGGIPANFKYSFSGRGSDWFVIEGDEYDTAFFDKVPKFTHYYPKNAILTGIEFDHVDIYDNLESVLDAFRLLLSSIPIGELLVFNGDDENIKKILEEKHYEFEARSYGQSNFCDFQLLNEKIVEGGTEVTFKFFNESVSFVGNWYGTYNSLNFLAATALLYENGFDLKDITASAKTFKGVARRQECHIDKEQLKVFEDFAHHPTAVRLTIESFKKRYPDYNLIAVFEPRSATSRRDVFQKEYVQSFLEADLAVISPVAKKTELDNFSSEKLVKDLNAKKVPVELPEKTADIPELITSKLTGKDVVLFMSNGGFEGVHLKFVEQMSR